MKSLEFAVVENLAGTGTVEGYFSVSRGDDNVMDAALVCNLAMHRAGQDYAPFIPIIRDEFMEDRQFYVLTKAYPDQLAGLVTFGKDMNTLGLRTRRATHFDVTVREFARHRPSFVAPFLVLPEGETNKSWKGSPILAELDLHYGSLTVSNEVCIIAVDENVPPLPQPNI
jgi:hypothetical protein